MRRCAVPLAFALAFSPAQAAAQTNTARIEGYISDPSGAAVPAASVLAIQVGTNLSWKAASGATGLYVVAGLPPGTFRVELRHAGFKTHITEDVQLESGRAVRIDAVLAIGELVDLAQVSTASSAALSTTGLARGATISSEEPARLPANGRNYLSLLMLVPGVTATHPQSFSLGQPMTSGGRPYINGNRKEATSFLLEGVDINQYTDNLVAYLPSPDALESVVLTTATAPAEWGNYLGGIVATRLKSGTNELRASAFAFARDEALNATNWAVKWQPVDPLNPSRKRPLEHWTIGGTAGGPLRRDRLFFFADFQRVKRRVGPTQGVFTVVPEAMRRGDFSALLEGANPQQLYDPLTTRPDPVNPARYLRDPFIGNLIPRERFSRVAAALFAHPLYSLPDYPGLVANKRSTTESNLEIDQGDVKVDGRVGATQMLSAHLSLSSPRTRTDVEPLILPGESTRSPLRSVGIRWNGTGRRSWIHEAVVGVSNIRLRLSSDDEAAAIGALGEAIGIAGANSRRDGLPSLGFTGGVGNPGVVQRADVRTLQLQDTVTWSRDRHTVKAGGLLLRVLQDAYFSGVNGQLGVFDFSGQYTRDLNDPRSFGSNIADFALGYPTRAARGDIAVPWQHKTTLYAGFVQMDWRPRADLTVNLGLRYEYRTPLVEAGDRQVTYDLVTGETRFAGRDGNSRALYEPYRADWQPRVGMAWTPAVLDARLVLRGAYGVSSFQEGTGTNLRLPLNPPFFNELELVNRDPAVLGLSIERGFEGLRERDPLTGSVLRALDPNYRPARSEQWHVTVETALAPSVLLSTGYVGQRGRHLAVPVNGNQAMVSGGPRPLDAALPQIGSVILTTSIGNQRYDALQTMVRKTHRHGWSLIASHTWGHAFSDSRGFYSDSGQSAEPATFWPNPRDRRAEWGSSAFDARHHVTMGWTLDLPWGRGRRWGGTVPGWMDTLTGGWSIDGAWRAHTGFAITVLAPDQSRTGARSGRPDRVGSGEGDREVGPGRNWFDTSAFVLPALNTFGNAATGLIRGPGLNIVDVAVGKRVPIGRSRIEVRVEAYNVFNTPVFNAPDRTLTSATFGEVRSSQMEREVQVGLKWVF